MRSLASELRQMPNITRTLMRKRTKVVGNSNKDTQLLELSVDEDKSENRVYINIVATWMRSRSAEGIATLLLAAGLGQTVDSHRHRLSRLCGHNRLPSSGLMLKNVATVA
mmetsp:Transcript_15069/g.24028  ORF Transcript_15069/g.24028 Transcript_15069/m.24028 type:complete len:110 (+) Transcript_15069:1015-1344(+)